MRWGLLLAGTVLCAAVLARADPDQGFRYEWTDVPAATGFKLYLRQVPTPGFGLAQDVGRPAPLANGHLSTTYLWSPDAPPGATMEAAVTAYDGGGRESLLSNICLAVIPTWTPTVTATASVTPTATATRTGTATATRTATDTAIPTNTATATATRTPTRLPAPTLLRCDLNGDGVVTRWERFLCRFRG